MSETVAITGLDRALEVAKNLHSVTTGNNLQLTDQIQFSSILKMTMDTPEQTLAAARGPVTPPERPARPEQAQSDRLAPRERVDEYAQAPEVGDKKPEFAANTVDDHRGDHGQPDDLPAQSNAPKQTDSDSSDGDESAVQAGQTTANVGDVEDAATDEFIAQVTKPDDVRANNSGDDTKLPADVAALQMVKPVMTATGKTSEAQGRVTSKSAHDVLSSALSSKAFQTVGEDIHIAVNDKAAAENLRSGNHSAGNAMRNQQANDLTQRLGGIQANIQVTVNENANPRAMPGHTLANGAHMAQMDPGDDGMDMFNANLNQSGGKGVAPDRAAAGNHGAAADGKALGQTVQQGEGNFGLAVRNQAIANANANAAANAAPKVPLITPESANVTNVTGPAGPSQVSQTAKLNPTTAARQPYKPPVPVEQISMQIQKAVGEGADKINIKLNPAHLGRVEVKLEIGKDGHLSAIILAERPETLSLLQKDAAGLEKALQEAGLRTDTASLNFGLKENSNTGTEPGRERENDHGGRPSENDDTPEDHKDQGLLQNANVYGRNMSANGGVDIRI